MLANLLLLRLIMESPPVFTGGFLLFLLVQDRTGSSGAKKGIFVELKSSV
jgi:hypothetical protein